MRGLFVALPGNADMAARLAALTGGDVASAEWRNFPDGETYIRLLTPASGRAVILVCALDRADEKYLPLAFAAETARELGAASVGLVAPYLGYMRQDDRFRPGEAVTSTIFARLISHIADWLLTVDPHLHRHRTLGEIYSIPAHVVPSAPLLASWVASEVRRPLLVGPDEESTQWVGAIAAAANAPYVVLNKVRAGDRSVSISLPDMERWHGYTPILVDDIISTGHTMIAALNQLRSAGFGNCYCAATHAVFAEGAYEALRAAQPRAIVTTNSISHPTNALDVSVALADAIMRRAA